MGFQKGNLLLPYLHSSNFVGICVYEYEHDCVEFLSFFIRVKFLCSCMSLLLLQEQPKEYV